MTPEQEIKVQIFDILQHQADFTIRQQKLEVDKQSLEHEKNLLIKKLEKLKQQQKDANEIIK